MSRLKQRTKIVCTIGPSTWDPKVLKKIIAEGMNVARINAAYADVPELDRVAKLIRSISDDVALMLDIKGNDVRLNTFEDALPLKKGQIIEIGSDPKKHAIYPKNHLGLHKDIAVGAPVFFDDGSVKAEVVEIKNEIIMCKVIEGKVLKPGKSMNTPGTHLSLPTVTNIDKEQIKFAVDDNWDFIAASYIRDKKDGLEVKKYTKGSAIQILAKVEEQMGVTNIDSILDVFDGIMIGRGDMGVELPYERIPVIQKMIIDKCNLRAKTVITATQVMDSMIERPSPTRAEISDVANAVWDGTDSIMTSGETSAGEYPIETVEAIARIAVENEAYLQPEIIEAIGLDHKHDIALAMVNAAFEVYQTLDIDKMVLFTESGTTARLISRYNVNIPVLAICANGTVKRQLALSKGITAYTYNTQFNTRNGAIKAILDHLLEKEMINKTDKIMLFGNAYNTSSAFTNISEYIDMKKFTK